LTPPANSSQGNNPVAVGDDRWLIALDIDGTLVHDDGFLSPEVVKEVKRVRALGHEVVVATGRSAANGIPVLRDLGIDFGHAVCSNGAVTIEVDPADNRGYRPTDVITFDPADVLTKLTQKLPNAHFAVEDIDGSYRFHRPFPTFALGDQNFETPLEELMSHPVSRVVVLSPEHNVQEFLDLIGGVGLHSVSYAIGYTAWLDISPEGVTKGSALEKIRRMHNIKPSQVIAVGDGRNDIPMFEWATSGGGISFAMGQAVDETKVVASEVTSSVEDDGVARVLSGFEGILFSRRLV
jgi:Cof subfamily protein (haloacid dehalogenase superfamily)